MAKKRKKHHEEEEMGESWLLPYADILTLLLALFIVLFASSTVDSKKLEQMSQVFNQVFDGGTGLLEQPSPIDVPIQPNNTNKDSESSAYIEDQQALAEIQNSVDEYIAVNELEKQFCDKINGRGPSSNNSR